MAYEPAWKRLVESLKDSSFESPYLDRLAARLSTTNLRVAAGLGSIEREIVEEMAYALGRAEDKVNAALLELDVAARAVDTADDEARHAAVAEFNALREAAITARWELLIHRESLGFRQNDMLPTYYPIPPKR